MCLRQLFGFFLIISLITSINSDDGDDINPGNPLAGRHLQVVVVDVRIHKLPLILFTVFII